MKMTKFATQVDVVVLKDLKACAKEQHKSISILVTEAISEYLKKTRMRPAFQSAMEEVLVEHEELLKRLAK